MAQAIVVVLGGVVGLLGTLVGAAFQRKIDDERTLRDRRFAAEQAVIERRERRKDEQFAYVRSILAEYEVATGFKALNGAYDMVRMAAAGSTSFVTDDKIEALDRLRQDLVAQQQQLLFRDSLRLASASDAAYRALGSFLREAVFAAELGCERARFALAGDPSAEIRASLERAEQVLLETRTSAEGRLREVQKVFQDLAGEFVEQPPH
jgi:hypothetical protein